MGFRKFGIERSVVTPDTSQDQSETIEAVRAATDHDEPESLQEHYDIPTVEVLGEEGPAR